LTFDILLFVILDIMNIETITTVVHVYVKVSLKNSGMSYSGDLLNKITTSVRKDVDSNEH
jgi:hypothetical protein